MFLYFTHLFYSLIPFIFLSLVIIFFLVPVLFLSFDFFFSRLHTVPKWTHPIMYSVVHFSYNSVQCKPNEHAVPYSADRGSGVDFLTVSGFLGESGTLVKTKELAVRSQIINILCPLPTPLAHTHSVIYINPNQICLKSIFKRYAW